MSENLLPNYIRKKTGLPQVIVEAGEHGVQTGAGVGPDGGHAGLPLPLCPTVLVAVPRGGRRKQLNATRLVIGKGRPALVLRAPFGHPLFLLMRKQLLFCLHLFLLVLLFFFLCSGTRIWKMAPHIALTFQQCTISTKTEYAVVSISIQINTGTDPSLTQNSNFSFNFFPVLRIWDPVIFLPLDPDPGYVFSGSRIPNPIILIAS